MRSSKTIRALALFAFLALFADGRVFAQVFAYDDAANAIAWTNNPRGISSQIWTNGMTTGFGWLSPWTLLQTTRDDSHKVYAGFYNGNGANIATTNASSWGMYANGNWNGATPLYNGTNKAVAFRKFPSLTSNQVFEIQWQCKGVASGGSSSNRGGFALRNGMTASSYLDYDAGSRFDFYFVAGGASFQIRDGTGTRSTGIPFNNAGLNCEFALQASNTYHFTVRSSTNSSVILYSIDSQPLAGSGTIDSVACYDLECQDGDQNFNRMQIISTSLLPPVISNVSPTNGAFFVNPSSSVTFEVDSQTSQLAGSNVTLLLNGTLQSLAFNSVHTNRLLATNITALSSNVTYTAAIVATDDNGSSVTNNFTFNTMQTNALWVDPRTYGATGNGTTKDTAAIQIAINVCPNNGYVWLHNGVFLSGTIVLKNNMTLYIDPTATLLGSGSTNDYPIQNPPVSNSQLGNCDMALVYAQGKTNVTIDGGGTINGNGRTNFTSGVEATRPMPIWTVLCSQVAIQNIHIVDSAMWTMVNMQSDYVTISNVTVNDDGLNGNRDGCDVVDCWHMVIANCTIDSGDDSICIKSGNARGVNDLLVKNCTITRSQSNGLKFGTASTGPFTNITFQDCTLQNVSHSAMAVESVDGSAVGNILFQRINFTSCQNAIFVVLGSRSGAAVGSVNGVTFRDITGSAMTDTRGNPISGCFTNGTTYRVKNILFDNVNISYAGGLGSIPSDPPEYAGQYPENTMWGNLPAYGYYLRHVSNVTFTNCYTGAASPDARPWIRENDVSGLSLLGPTLNIIPDPANLILQWNNNFILQSATSVLGPFSDIPGAPNPFTNSSGPSKFFRLRQP